MPSIFISHSKADKSFARKITADLQRAGGEVWLDLEQIQLSDSIRQKVQQAIDACDFFAVILSPDAVASNWVKQELDQAFDRQLAKGDVDVLPLLYRDCEIPGFLRGKFYADFRNSSNYVDALNIIKQKLGLPLTQTQEEADLLTMMMTHQVGNLLVSLDAGFRLIERKAPELVPDLRHLSALTANARRTFMQQAIVQMFATGTYQLKYRFVDANLFFN